MENKDRPQPQKMNLQPGDLKEYFINHLNKIYCAKNHLVHNFPAILDLATFADLKEAIEENINDLRNQIARMREIYEIMNEKYEPQSCQMFVGLIDDLYDGIKRDSSLELQDM